MYQILLKQYKGTTPILEEAWSFTEENQSKGKLAERFPCRIQYQKWKNGAEEHFVIRTEAFRDTELPVSVSFCVTKEDWKKTEYVFMPAAVYNGNRMESKYLPYPPYHTGKMQASWEPIITDIPHLNKNGKGSRIQFLSGDMSSPVMGYFDETAKSGLLVMTKHIIAGRYTGFTVAENDNQASFIVTCPGVRENNAYFFGELPSGEGFYPTCKLPSDDEGILLKAGDVLEFEVVCINISAQNLNGYFTEFNNVREMTERGEAFDSIPFSKAFSAVKEKYIKMHFTDEGYYRIGTENTSPLSFWQAGWVGGGMNCYPLLMEDYGIARDQSISTIKFIIQHLQRENGWYIPVYSEGTAYGDCFLDVNEPVLLVRKDADLLYFLLKQAFYLKEHGEIIDGLDVSMQAQADAFVRFFEKNGELGQFIHMETEELLQGGTACGAIAPAALALAWEYFKKPEYLKTAEALGELYWKQYLRKGILNGGPGEICQAPDSESAFALLESFVQLYETTEKDCWLNAAKEAFELAITWVVSYDFAFPEGSTAKKIGAHSCGTVFANAQNKHSAPGICTLSGNSMLKLYRFTGDEKYLKWMSRISHALSQFVSLEERPIDTLSNKPLLPGYFNERVQTSDWEGKHTVGEFLYGSNWPETTMLLTYVEIPGIYVDSDKDRIVCSDHIHADLLDKTDEKIVLRLHNDTAYDAVVTVLVDHSKDAKKMGHLYFGKMEKISIKSGEVREASVCR